MIGDDLSALADNSLALQVADAASGDVLVDRRGESGTALGSGPLSVTIDFDDTLIVLSAAGELFKVGHIECRLLSIDNYPGCVLVEEQGQTVNFNDADFNGDGSVNAVDLGILRSQFFSAPGPSGPTPECVAPVSGSFTVWGTWSFDLDSGAQVGFNNRDFFCERATATVAFFTPRDGVLSAVIGSTVPSQADSVASPLRAGMCTLRKRPFLSDGHSQGSTSFQLQKGD